MTAYEPQPDGTEVTATITKYHDGNITWNDLVAFIKQHPWQAPNLPDAMDYNGWDGPPDTFQDGTWGEVHGAFWEELLTEDEYWKLTDIFDTLPRTEIKAVLPGTGGVVISDDFDDRDVYHPR